MRILVIDTSSAAVTAGVLELSSSAAEAAGVSVLAERITVNARAHGELLAPAIRDCLDRAGLSLAELAAVVAGVGPGPFTGLRVGLVTAAALADASGLPSYPVCSLDAIASQHADVEDLLVAGDARRKEIYWARYRNGVRVDGPAVDKPELLAGQGTAAVGAGAVLYQSVLGLPVLAGDYPSPAGLATVAAGQVLGHAPSQSLTPLYLRRPDAVAGNAGKSVSQAKAVSQ